MDPVRVGLSIRALRRRRGWTQEELGRRAGLSRSAVSRIERGEADRLSLRTLAKVTNVLGARIRLQVLWQGEEMDRLLDRDHAHLVEWVVRRLTADGWEVAPEATFQVNGERGSIDVFAWHPATGHLLVVEVKSVVPDVQATLAGVDRKARVAVAVARQRGWPPGPVSRVLVLPDDRTARRRLSRFAATFDKAFPARTVELRRWFASPDGPIAGVLFVSNATQAGARHRVGVMRASATHEVSRRR
ncbi:MAG TPA: helix-turn-helix transcriptional regulator [Candidatus Limnocylindrales bacterium]